MHLNTSQQEAVDHDGHVLISAPPGSGKTSVLAHRSTRLLKRATSARLVAVTFTVDSARELGARIARMHPAGVMRTTTATFHALAKRQLEACGQRVNLVRESARHGYIARAVKEAMKSFGASTQPASNDDILVYIDGRKAAGLEGNHAGLEGASRDTGAWLDEVYSHYNALLRQNAMRDMGDLLLDAVSGMRDGNLKPLPCEFMLVDEFQDADRTQYQWMLEHLRIAKTELTAVGDDDQSIYGWRHAMGYAGFERFLADTVARHVILDTCYRCARPILEVASQLIRHNSDRVSKRVRPANSSEATIRTHGCGSVNDEAERFAEAVRQWTESGGQLAAWGLLARTNEILDTAEGILATSQIAYRRSGGESFWRSTGPAEFLAFIASFFRGESSGIDKMMRCIPDLDPDARKVVLAACATAGPGRAFRAFADARTTNEDLVRLQELVRDWVLLMDDGQDRMLVVAIEAFLGDHVAALTGRTSRGNKAIINRMGAASRLLLSSKGPLKDAVQWMLKARSSNATDAIGGVSLMTLHAAKGLEFDRVWLMGCSEGVLPSMRTSSIEEERRLLYVGITRAKYSLDMSFAMASGRGGPSRFLQEAQGALPSV